MNAEKTNKSNGRFWSSIKLIEELFDKDGMRRQNARLKLEKEGRSATPLLIAALKFSNNTDVKWETAKALIKIRDPLAAEALADALMDEDYEVRWLAGEALIALGKDSLIPLLRKLLGHYDSPFLRAGTHHVLEKLKQDQSLDKEIFDVLEESNDILPLEPYPMAAKRVLDTLLQKEKKQNEQNQNLTAVENG